MSVLGITITLQAPTLMAASPPGSNLVESLAFIPGNALRGVLARRYLEKGKADADDFKALFLSGQVRYGFATKDGAHWLPLSARSCKYDGGFSEDKGHGMVDLLLVGDGPVNCPHSGCGQSIDYCKGFWEPDQYRKVTVDHRLITRTAIDARRSAARDGALYSQRVLGEGQVFKATIESDKQSLIERLKPLIGESYTARLGGATSRGQGWATLATCPPSRWSLPSLAQRYNAYRQQCKAPVLMVTLLSDGLFRDAYLRDRTAPTLADLAGLGINPDDWDPHPHKAFMDTRLVFGFDGEPIYLPRQPRLAVAAGSVFMFKAKEGVARPTIPNKGNGLGWIGDNNAEGYGRAVLWHPFHGRPEKGWAPSEPKIERYLIDKAQELYGQGFAPKGSDAISAAQMAHIGELILGAGDLKQAISQVSCYLNKQLKKLQKRVDRGEPPQSWLVPGPDDGSTRGERLKNWIAEQRYLPNTVTPSEAERLRLLQRFWTRFHGLYRYEAAMGKPMALCHPPESS